MCELGNITMIIDDVEYETILLDYQNNPDYLRSWNNKTKEYILTRGRDSSYNFTISYNNEIENAIRNTNKIQIKWQHSNKSIQLTNIEGLQHTGRDQLIISVKNKKEL